MRPLLHWVAATLRVLPLLFKSRQPDPLYFQSFFCFWRMRFSIFTHSGSSFSHICFILINYLLILAQKPQKRKRLIYNNVLLLIINEEKTLTLINLFILLQCLSLSAFYFTRFYYSRIQVLTSAIFLIMATQTIFG